MERECQLLSRNGDQSDSDIIQNANIVEMQYHSKGSLVIKSQTFELHWTWL